MQEGCVAATVCKEKQLLKIFENGYDFHSYCASLLFPEEWTRLGGKPEPKDKPTDKLLLKRRNQTKATTFGLFYGKSAVGLANDLDLFIGVEDLILNFEDDANSYIYSNIESKEYTELYQLFCNENYFGSTNKNSRKAFLKQEHKAGNWKGDVVTADDLIERFFNVFPAVKENLVNGADIAVQQCHVRTSDVFGRIRFFDTPENTKEEKAIHRQAMNFPIQSSSANMTKYAIVLCKKYIDEHNLADKVKFFLPIHDEIICVAQEDFAQEWLGIQIKLMEDAGELILGHKLQKAEGNISDFWSK